MSKILEPVSHWQGVFTISKALHGLFRRERRLSPEFAARLRNRHHGGFQVYRGAAVEPGDLPALERLCAYIGRAVLASTRRTSG